MWTKFKGQVLRGKDEKDNNDEDTIVTRALLKYYDPEVPAWLLPPDSALRERLTSLHLAEASSAPIRYPEPVAPQPFTRRESAPRLFDRQSEPGFVPPPVGERQSPRAAPGSGLASRLKSTRW